MNGRRTVRCAIYSLDAQREAAEAYIQAQAHAGWVCLPARYDDGGFSGGNLERPALQRLLADIAAGQVDVVVTHKVDRLSRSLLDFARMMEVFEKHQVSFVSITQQFNSATSVGRLVLNILLSFAQFEREIISERTRDKIAATRRKGKWLGGLPLLGYNVAPRRGRLRLNRREAERVRAIFALYMELGSLLAVVRELKRRHWRTKCWVTRKGLRRGGRFFTKTALYFLLTNVAYTGQVRYKDEVHPGEHKAIVSEELFERVQALLRRNRAVPGARCHNGTGGLLHGLLHCAACDGRMTHTYS
jgi:site-specific DNA recombinase